MTDIYKIQEITKVSLKTLRKIEKHGFLKVTKTGNPTLEAIRANLKKGNRVTALQQLHLLKNDDWRKSLSAWEIELDELLANLGDVAEHSAPWQGVASQIDLASKKDPHAIQRIADWMKSVISFDPGFDNGAAHDHAYMAVRLAYNVPEHAMEHISEKLTSCFWQCRRHEFLHRRWRINDKGQTEYFRPKKEFDL